jgi:hypothetical protein
MVLHLLEIVAPGGIESALTRTRAWSNRGSLGCGCALMRTLLIASDGETLRADLYGELPV